MVPGQWFSKLAEQRGQLKVSRGAVSSSRGGFLYLPLGLDVLCVLSPDPQLTGPGLGPPVTLRTSWGQIKPVSLPPPPGLAAPLVRPLRGPTVSRVCSADAQAIPEATPGDAGGQLRTVVAAGAALLGMIPCCRFFHDRDGCFVP